MIKFRCSHCNKKFGVPDDYAGRRIRCNTCDHHTIVPKTSTEPANGPDTASPPRPADKPIPYQDKTDDDIVLTLSKEDAPAAAENTSPERERRDGQTNSNQPQEDKPLELQLQSFHHYQSSAPDSNIDLPDSGSTGAAKDNRRMCSSAAHTPDDPKKVNRKLSKKQSRKFEVDRIEQALTILSHVSCIGPILFIVMVIHIMVALAAGESPEVVGLRRSHSSRHKIVAAVEPNTVTTSEPNAVATNNSSPTPALWVLIKYAFYTFSYGLSPIALVAAMFLVLKYCYDMPKTLYFSIVMHGLIFLNLFRG